MKYLIQKERLHLMSPAVNVCAMATWNVPLDSATLKNAIRDAVRHHAILRCRVTLGADGTANLETLDEEPALSIAEFSGDVEPLISEQDQIPFEIDKGETIRFFYGGDASRPTLVVIVHHLVCDGGSIMILMRDILISLNGQSYDARDVQLLTRDDLPPHPGLGLFLRAIMRNTNAKWKQKGRAFDLIDYRRMFEAYAHSHPTVLALHTISKAQMARIKQLTHERHITINSLVATAFAATLPRGESVGMPIDIRPEGRTGMGNYAIGFGVQASYDERQSFIDNAVSMHRSINRKFNTPKDRFFLHEFMGSMSPTLIDSIYFCGYGGYDEAISRSVCKMCGYIDQPKGITISNIKTIAMPDDPDLPYHYETLCLIPPYIPNVRSVIGVSTYRNEMMLSLRTVSNECGTEETTRFERACGMLDLL